jgi:hypothetical protein
MRRQRLLLLLELLLQLLQLLLPGTQVLWRQFWVLRHQLLVHLRLLLLLLRAGRLRGPNSGLRPPWHPGRDRVITGPHHSTANTRLAG